MDVDRHVERFGAREDRREHRIVEELAVGRAADERAAQTQLAHGAFEFVGRRFGCGQRKMRERRVAFGARAHDFSQRIVVAAGKRGRGIGR